MICTSVPLSFRTMVHLLLAITHCLLLSLHCRYIMLLDFFTNISSPFIYVKIHIINHFILTLLTKICSSQQSLHQIKRVKKVYYYSCQNTILLSNVVRNELLSSAKKDILTKNCLNICLILINHLLIKSVQYLLVPIEI